MIYQETIKQGLAVGQGLTRVDDSRNLTGTNKLYLEQVVKLEAFWSPTFMNISSVHTRWTDDSPTTVRAGREVTFGIVQKSFTTSDREDVYKFDPSHLLFDPTIGYAPYDDREEIAELFPSTAIYLQVATNYFTEYMWWLDKWCERMGWDKFPIFQISKQRDEYMDLNAVSAFWPQRLISGELVPDPTLAANHRDPDTGEAYETVLKGSEFFELTGWYLHSLWYMLQIRLRLDWILVNKLKFTHPTNSNLWNIFPGNIRHYTKSQINDGINTFDGLTYVEYHKEQSFDAREERSCEGFWTPTLEGVGKHGKMSRHDYARLLPTRPLTTPFTNDSDSIFDPFGDATATGDLQINGGNSCPVRGFSTTEIFRCGESWWDYTPNTGYWPTFVNTDYNVWAFASLSTVFNLAYADQFRFAILEYNGTTFVVNNASSWYPIEEYASGLSYTQGGAVQAALSAIGFTGESYRIWGTIAYPSKARVRQFSDLYSSFPVYFGDLEDANYKGFKGGYTNNTGDKRVVLQTRYSATPTAISSFAPNGLYIPPDLNYGPCFDGDSCPTVNYGDVPFTRTKSIEVGSGYKPYGLNFTFSISIARSTPSPTNSSNVSYEKPLGVFNYWPLNGRSIKEAFGVFPAVDEVTFNEQCFFSFASQTDEFLVSPRNPMIGYKIIAFCSQMTLHQTGKPYPSATTSLNNGVETISTPTNFDLKIGKLIAEGISGGTVIYEVDFDYSTYLPDTSFSVTSTSATSNRHVTVDISDLITMFNTPCESFCLAMVPIYADGIPDWTVLDMAKEGGEMGEGYTSLIPPIGSGSGTSPTPIFSGTESVQVSLYSEQQGPAWPVTVPPTEPGHWNPLTDDARRHRYYFEIGPFRIPCLMPMMRVSN